MAREAWTDERLDDFKENVNRRFDEVDRRFDRLEERFDSMQRTIIGFVTLFASIAASVIGAVLATQL